MAIDPSPLEVLTKKACIKEENLVWITIVAFAKYTDITNRRET